MAVPSGPIYLHRFASPSSYSLFLATNPSALKLFFQYLIMVGPSSRSLAQSDKPTMQAPSPPTSPLEKKTFKGWTSAANEPSGSFSRGTQHRRKSSTTQEKGKTTATKSEVSTSVGTSERQHS